MLNKKISFKRFISYSAVFFTILISAQSSANATTGCDLSSCKCVERLNDAIMRVYEAKLDQLRVERLICVRASSIEECKDTHLKRIGYAAEEAKERTDEVYRKSTTLIEEKGLKDCTVD